MNRNCHNIGIFINPIYEFKNKIFSSLKELNDPSIEFYLIDYEEEEIPYFIKHIDRCKKIMLDAIIVFGGDGTILRSVSYGLKYNTPLVGINVGNLGFLSEGNFGDLEKVINLLKSGKYQIQSRTLFDVSLIRKGKSIYRGICLNDAVIYKGLVPKLVDVKIYNNKRFVLSTRCDGVVISTPTGSTAYSLSAGGPIMSPVMDAMILAPLNPHILSVRPMIFPSNDKLKLKIENTHEETILQLDGRNVFMICDNDEIAITEAKSKIQFVKISNRTFYQTLRRKMHMGKL